jgi:predicted nucleic acid-binding Zn ribbon protein
MATYVYETIPQTARQKPRRFEIEQKMTEDALTHDPKTGEPVRRIIVGGSGGFVTRGTSILSMNRPKRR